MPIYEYRCGACGHEIEALQKMSDGPLRKCPECGKSQLRRLVSAPSFRLKGGGWYETDFKGNGEKKRNLVETAGGESSDSSSAKADVSADSGKDSASKEASAKVVETKASDSASADKKPKLEKAGKAAAKKSASKPNPHPKKSARA
jgi:putative FmdB family regulatory protein